MPKDAAYPSLSVEILVQSNFLKWNQASNLLSSSESIPSQTLQLSIYI